MKDTDSLQYDRNNVEIIICKKGHAVSFTFLQKYIPGRFDKEFSELYQVSMINLDLNYQLTPKTVI